MLHFLLVYLAFEDLSKFNIQMSQTSVLAITGFLIWTLTSLGMIFDKSTWAWPSELARAALFLTLYVKFGTWNEFRMPSPILYASFTVSMIISIVSIASRGLSSSKTSLKKE